MASITTIQGTDLISDSRSDINTNFDNLNDDKIETSYLDTDGTLAANSDTKIPTQKAVKTYVDSVASPTGKSWNEYAVDAVGTDTYAITVAGVTAYVAGQTFKFRVATANTGACTVNINGLGAKSMVKNVSESLATGDILANQIVEVMYDGTNMQVTSLLAGLKDSRQLTNVPLMAYQQDISLTSTTGAVTNNGNVSFGSSSDGSVLYGLIGVTTSAILYRFARDTATGQYFQTHTVNPTLALPSADTGSIIEIGIYIYVFSNDGTNIICSRFLAANLTGEQVMTVPVVTCASACTAWTDGTNAYITSSSSNTTSRTWTLSGTTFTASSTATVAGLTDIAFTAMYDGTTAYVGCARIGTSDIIINKLSVITGATKTTATKTLGGAISDLQSGSVFANIDSTRMYIGFVYANYNELNADAVISYCIRLIPISKP